VTATRPITLTCAELRIPFVVSFRHASAERSETATVWVRATDGPVDGHGEGCPRPYVTGETVATARAFFAAHRGDIEAMVVDVGSLRRFVQEHSTLIDAHPAAWCAVELALLDLFARRDGVTVDALLGLPSLAPSFGYTAVVGDVGPEGARKLAAGYTQMGFADFKLKLSGQHDRDAATVAAVRAAAPTLRSLRLDANNLWPTRQEAFEALRGLDGPFAGVEEPIAAGDYAGLGRLSDELGCPAILDESLARVQQVDHLPVPLARFIVNVRVSKMGGLLRSLAVVASARSRGLGVIVGAQVGETSLLTRAALTVATAAGSALVGQEGAFGTHLLQHDVALEPLMFGARGRVTTSDRPSLSMPGWGLSVDDATLSRCLRL
jgi:L-alanine-DL-glutamate epimerase-like enolase superfamily enzyme